MAREPGVSVTIVEPSPVFRERIRLHQWAAGQRARARPLRELVAPGVTLRRTRAEAIDLKARRVRLADGRALIYDQLVLAVGSVVERGRVPGVAQHCLSLETDEDCRAIAAQGRAGGRLVVVGLGLTGIEAACELAEAWPELRVTLLGRGRLEQRLSPAGAAHVRTTLVGLGVTLIEATTVTAVRAGVLELGDGATLEFAGCVWAAGFVAPTLAAEAGLPVTADGRVVVDACLRVPGHPEVLVVGDAAQVVVDGSMPLRMACATAMPMGAHAAEQVLLRMHGLAGTPLYYGASLACISLGRHEALVQLLTPEDLPRPRIVRGRLAVFVKEAICRMTVVVLRAEARGIRLYRWPQPRTRDALPAAAKVH